MNMNIVSFFLSTPAPVFAFSWANLQHGHIELELFVNGAENSQYQFVSKQMQINWAAAVG